MFVGFYLKFIRPKKAAIRSGMYKCVVEIKRKKRIDESVEAEVCEKLNRLKLARNISRRTALVYEGALSQSVQDNGFFDFIVPVSELLH